MSSDTVSTAKTVETIQVVYEPGCKTGIYYIPFGNLPFGTSWQELKDWLRCASAVEHVQVFEGSTSGWVRVKGEANFNRAMNRLTNDCFNGRALMPDSRNRDRSVMIKELVDRGQPRQTAGYGLAASPRTPHYASSTMSQSEMSHSQWNPLSSTQSSHFAGGSPLMNPPMAYPLSQGVSAYRTSAPPISQPVPPPVAYSSSEPHYYYSYQNGGLDLINQNSMSHYSYNTPQQQQYSQYYGRQEGFEDESADYGSPSSSTSGTVVTEHRKIIIKHVGHRTTEDQIQGLLSKAMKQGGVKRDLLKKVEIPRGSENRPRGHVFAQFKSWNAAKVVIDQLDGKSWNGRTLDAGFTSEGVVVPDHDHAESHRANREEKKEKKQKKEKAKNAARSSSPSSPMSRSMAGLALLDKQDRQGSGPVIVDGSYRKPKLPK